MTTTQEPDHITRQPRPRSAVPSRSALTLAAYLISRPRPSTGESDACLRTHDRVRVDGVSIVHRLDVRARTLYTTGCGLRIAKTDGVLTADAVDCRHHGCEVTA